MSDEKTEMSLEASINALKEFAGTEEGNKCGKKEFTKTFKEANKDIKIPDAYLVHLDAFIASAGVDSLNNENFMAVFGDFVNRCLEKELEATIKSTAEKIAPEAENKEAKSPVEEIKNKIQESAPHHDIRKGEGIDKLIDYAEKVKEGLKVDDSDGAEKPTLEKVLSSLPSNPKSAEENKIDIFMKEIDNFKEAHPKGLKSKTLTMKTFECQINNNKEAQKSSFLNPKSNIDDKHMEYFKAYLETQEALPLEDENFSKKLKEYIENKETGKTVIAVIEGTTFNQNTEVKVNHDDEKTEPKPEPKTDEHDWVDVFNKSLDTSAGKDKKAHSVTKKEPHTSIEGSYDNSSYSKPNKDTLDAENGSQDYFNAMVKGEKKIGHNVVNFGDIKDDDFKAKLMIACVKEDMKMRNAPSFEDLKGISQEMKAEYTAALKEAEKRAGDKAKKIEGAREGSTQETPVTPTTESKEEKKPDITNETSTPITKKMLALTNGER